MKNLAGVYYYQGKYAKAENLYLEALKIMEDTLGKDHLDYAITLNNLALLYFGVGNYNKSEILYLEALKIMEAILENNNRDYAISLNNLASIYKLEGDYNKSEILCLEALQIIETILGKNHPDYTIVLNNLAELYMDMNNYFKAESLFLEALAITLKVSGKDHPNYVIHLHNLALMFYYQGMYSKAESYYLEALQITKDMSGEKYLDYATLLGNLALLYENSGMYFKAEVFYIDAIQNKIIEIENSLSNFSEKERKSYVKSIQTYFDNFYIFTTEYYKEKPEIAAELFNLQLFTKALIFQSTQKMQEQILNSNDDELIEEYYAWKAKRGQLAKAIQMTKEERQNAGIDLDILEEEANRMEKELSQKSEVFAEATRQYTWQDAQAKLKESEALVEVIRIRNIDENEKISTAYIALILKPDSKMPQILVLENGDDLEGKWKENYFKRIDSLNDEEYYNQFWKPLKPYLEGIEKVYFSPDGVYYQINLLTLQNLETKEYLIDEIDIQLLGSPKDLISLDTERQDFEVSTIALFGYPEYANYPTEENFKTTIDKSYEFENLLEREENAADKTRFFKGGKVEVLKHSLTEVNNIAELADKQKITPTKFLELDANEENIKKLKSPDILHIATHGFFLANLPEESNDKMGFMGMGKEKFVENPLLRSGLLLAGAEKTWNGEKAKGEDGVLTAEEVIMIDLSRTELVVLSACETGLGELDNGEGIYGLQRSFQQAGAKTVIMSLWNVSDIATKDMMTFFYENLLIKGQSTREAFRNAQLKIREKAAKPRYWGAFVLVGE